MLHSHAQHGRGNVGTMDGVDDRHIKMAEKIFAVNAVAKRYVDTAVIPKPYADAGAER